MFFSKSFGYALRSILYLSSEHFGERVNPEEIASKLKIPRHFLAKIMKMLAKEGIIQSQKGPSGGFSASQNTLETSVLKVAEITGETTGIGSCVLSLRKCNSQNPCPMHYRVFTIRNQLLELLSSTTIQDLLKKEYPDFIKSIAAV